MTSGHKRELGVRTRPSSRRSATATQTPARAAGRVPSTAGTGSVEANANAGPLHIIHSTYFSMHPQQIWSLVRCLTRTSTRSGVAVAVDTTTTSFLSPSLSPSLPLSLCPQGKSGALHSTMTLSSSRACNGDAHHSQQAQDASWQQGGRGGYASASCDRTGGRIPWPPYAENMQPLS